MSGPMTGAVTAAGSSPGSAATAPASLPTAALTAARVVLKLTDLARDFADRPVLGPVNLNLDAGTLAVVSGPNGAGKTTLLRIAAGLLAPSAGSRLCTGRAVYLRPGAGARAPLRVGQVLTQTAAFAGTPAEMLAEAVTAAGLGELTDQRVAELSAGQRARLTVALAVTANPVLACLDEPTAHLDTSGVQQVRAVVRLLREAGTSVLLVSHTPGQFADTADAVLRLEHGRLRDSGC